MENIKLCAVINDDSQILIRNGIAVIADGIYSMGDEFPAGIDYNLQVIGSSLNVHDRPINMNGSSLLNFTHGEQLYLFAYLEYKDEIGEETKTALIGVFTDYKKFLSLTEKDKNSIKIKIQKINEILDFD